MRIIRLSLPSRNKRDKAWLTYQTRFWAASGNPPYQSQWVVLPEHRSPVFVPGYRFVHSGGPLRGTIEAEDSLPALGRRLSTRLASPLESVLVPCGSKDGLWRSALGRVTTDLVLTGTSNNAF